jgi:hypothetical protein
VLQISSSGTAATRSIPPAESRRLEAGGGLPVSSGDSSGRIPRHQLQEGGPACAAAFQHLARRWQKDEGLAASQRLRQLSCRCACASACCRQPNQWSLPLGKLSPLFQHGHFSTISGWRFRVGNYHHNVLSRNASQGCCRVQRKRGRFWRKHQLKMAHAEHGTLCCRAPGRTAAGLRRCAPPLCSLS